MHKKKETGGTVRYGVSDGGFGERGRRGLKFTDEPTGNLDSLTSDKVIGLLKMTSEKFRQTIVMITHNPEIAEKADVQIRIEDGKIHSQKAQSGKIYA